MPNVTILGSIMWEVINNGQQRALEDDEINTFYSGFRADVSEKIEEIRSEQRRAYEEGKSLILS